MTEKLNLSPKMREALMFTEPGDLMKAGPTRAALMRRGLVYKQDSGPWHCRLTPAGKAARSVLLAERGATETEVTVDGRTFDLQALSGRRETPPPTAILATEVEGPLPGRVGWIEILDGSRWLRGVIVSAELVGPVHVVRFAYKVPAFGRNVAAIPATHVMVEVPPAPAESHA